MSLLCIDYCMTCAEGLHFSGFHYTSKKNFNMQDIMSVYIHAVIPQSFIKFANG